MNINTDLYSKLLLPALVPVAVALAYYLLQRFTVFGRAFNKFQQAIIGITFGAVAVFATEFAVDFGGATVALCDIAPLSAGLLFGGPAGIIAGVIGAVERFFAVNWGADTYTALADSISLLFAGLYASFLRNKLFDSKTPGPGIALATGVVMEVIHLTIAFITHISEAGEMFEIIKICTFPMIISVAVSLCVSCAIINLIDLFVDGKIHYLKTITQKMQSSLIVVVVIAYLITTLFVYALQTSTADYNAADVIDTTISDIKSDVIDSVNENILTNMHRIRNEYSYNPNVSLNSLADRYNVDEINFVNSKGIIEKSTDESYIDFDMNSNKDSAEFLVLLDGTTTEYIQEARQNALDSNGFRKYVGLSVGGGFLQVGLDLDKFSGFISQRITAFTENRHIGINGYVMISDQNRTVVSGGEFNGKNLADIGIDLDVTKTYSGIYKTSISDVPSVYKYVVSEGYYILGVMSQEEVYSTREASTYVNSFMLVIIFVIIFLLIFFVIKRVVLKDISSINSDVTTIASGDLGVWLHNNSTAEFASLSNGINQAVATLKEFNEKEKAKFEEELELAKNIQLSALPTSFPAPYEFNIYANMRTAKEVGGDFYDFYMIDKNHLVFMIADVSGKGVPAAMFMMTAKTMIKNLTESGITENEVFNRANEKLCEGNDAGMFVTAWMGILDTSTGHVKFVNAGHNPPVIYRNGMGYDFMQCKSNFVLSGMETSKYKIQEFDMQPGDKILLYTDGVTEATNIADALYGEERLKKYLNTVTDCDVAKTISGVLRDIDVFVGSADQFDDITMVMVQYNGPIPTINND